jgi:hypothetical protein
MLWKLGPWRVDNEHFILEKLGCGTTNLGTRHTACYNLTTDSSKVNDFVCYACMADVGTMYQTRVVVNES